MRLVPVPLAWRRLAGLLPRVQGSPALDRVVRDPGRGRPPPAFEYPPTAGGIVKINARQHSVTGASARPTTGPAQALRLRRLGLSYEAISVVMSEYHGMHVSCHTWRRRLRKMGAGPVRLDLAGRPMAPALAAHKRGLGQKVPPDA
jgi:hypothetical protein